MRSLGYPLEISSLFSPGRYLRNSVKHLVKHGDEIQKKIVVARTRHICTEFEIYDTNKAATKYDKMCTNVFTLFINVVRNGI